MDGSRHAGVLVISPVSLPLVDLGVPLALVTAGKLSSTLTAGERLLPGVCADVSGKMVTAAEIAHTDAALERLMTRVHALVARQLIRPGETAIAAFRRTDVWTFMRRQLALKAGGNLFGSAWFCDVSLGGRDRALRLNLRGEGFDGGQRCEWRLQWQRIHALWKFLVQGRTQVAILLLLRQQIIWKHRYHHR